MNVPELKAIANKLAIVDADVMTKAQLLAAIKVAEETELDPVHSGPDDIEKSPTYDEAEFQQRQKAIARAEQSEREEADLANHPKFSKFKTGVSR